MHLPKTFKIVALQMACLPACLVLADTSMAIPSLGLTLAPQTCLSFTTIKLLLFVDFTLEAKLVSSKHLAQVHLKISSRTLKNLASHLMTKYIT